MQIPKKTKSSDKLRSISTSNVEQLAQFQVNKNRHYTQLQAGAINSHYIEVNLGGVQLFREKLTAGSRIEASPSAMFAPFASVLPASGDFNFCGRERKDNTIIQAAGGEWDISFKDQLDYVCTAFDRNYLYHNTERLTGRPVPKTWLVSQPSVTCAGALQRYSQGVANILHTLQSRPAVLADSNALRMLSAEVLTLTINALTPTNELGGSLKPHAHRILGVRRVIDYLQVHAAMLPTMAELCEIAALSERSLEYGFREYLDITPIRYLRLVRLNGVRRDLLAATNTKGCIVNAALNWGFVEMGRFSGEYKQLFEELPSQTIRKTTS